MMSRPANRKEKNGPIAWAVSEISWKFNYIFLGVIGTHRSSEE